MSAQKSRSIIVAIVGGSGSGKTWLADQLQQTLGEKAARLCLDDFYRDRSHLPAARRQLVNFDHPRAIDWISLENVLNDLLRKSCARVPAYDFMTHCRHLRPRVIRAKPVLLLEGLWLLRRRALRRLFALSIFLDCPASTRLRRRLERDRLSRGRTESSVRRQFARNVEPMHGRYVVPQRLRADVVLSRPCDPDTVRLLSERILACLSRGRGL